MNLAVEPQPPDNSNPGLDSFISVIDVKLLIDGLLVVNNFLFFLALFSFWCTYFEYDFIINIL